MSSQNTISGFGKSTDNAFNLDVDHLQVNEGEDIYKRSDFYGPVTFHDTVTLDEKVIINADVEAKTFTATDATNQFVVRNASNFDFKVATSTSPVFNFRDQNNSLATSTIEANIIHATQINNTQTTSATTSNSLVFSSQKNSGTSSGSSAGYVVQNSDNDSAGVYMQSSAGGKRGQIRSSSTAFGLDLQTDGYGTGANKSIKLYTDHTTINSDLSVLSTSIFYGDATLTGGSSLLFNGATSGTTILKVPALAGSYNFILPTTSGSIGQVLTSSGGNALTWTTILPNFTTPISTVLDSSFTSSQNILTLVEPQASTNTFQKIILGVNSLTYNQAEIAFNYKGSGNDNNNISIGLSNSPAFRFYPALGLFEAPIFRLLGSTEGYINLFCPATTTNYSLTFPPSSGSNGQILTTDGTGTTSWVSPSITPTFTSLILTSTDPALNATTGALQVAGGISVNRKSYIAPSYIIPFSGVINGVTAGLVIDRPSFSSSNPVNLQFGATVHIKGAPDYQGDVQPIGEATAFSLIVEDTTQLDVLIGTGSINSLGTLGCVGLTTLLGGVDITGGTVIYGAINQSLGSTTLSGPSLEGTFSSTMQLTSANEFTIESTSALLSSKIKSAYKLNLEGNVEVLITSAKLTATISGATNITTGSSVYKTETGNLELESKGSGGFSSTNSLNLTSTTSDVNITADNDIKLDAEVAVGIFSKSSMRLQSLFILEMLSKDDLSISAGHPDVQNSNISINTILGAINLNTQGGSVSTGTTGGDIELDARNEALTGGGEITLKGNKLTGEIISDIFIETTGATSTLDLATAGGVMQLYTKGGDLKLDTRNTALTGGGELFFYTNKVTLDVISNIIIKTTGATSTLDLATAGGIMKLATKGGGLKLDTRIDALTSGGHLELFSGQFSTKALTAIDIESLNSTLNLKTNNQLLKLSSKGGAMEFDSTFLTDKGAMTLTSGAFNVNASGELKLESTDGQTFKTTTFSFAPMTFETNASNMFFTSAGGKAQFNLLTSPTTGGDFNVYSDKALFQTNNGFTANVLAGNFNATVTTGDMDIKVLAGTLDINTGVGALNIKATAGALNIDAIAGTLSLKGAIISGVALGAVSFSGAGAASLTGGGALTLSGGGSANLTGGGATTIQGGGLLSLTGLAAVTMSSIGLMTITAGSALNMNVAAGALTLNVFAGGLACTVVGGLLALTCGVGGITLTTAAGVLSLISGVGKISLGTLGGDIELGTGLAGNIKLAAGLGAVSILANSGGVNIGCESETDTGHRCGHFAVKTVNGTFDAATANISFVTASTGVLQGPGNFTVDTSLARLGNVDFNCKGRFKLKAGGDGYGHYIYFNTTAMLSDYFFTFPSTPGTPGQVLTTQGDGQIMTWEDVNTNTNPSYFVLTTGTYDMVATSPSYTNITVSTGGAVQIKLPDATTLLVGAQYFFNCNGTTPVHLKKFTNSSIVNINPGSVVTLLLTSTATSAGVWDWHEQLPSGTKWSTAALTTPSTITTQNTTDASGVNTGALISLGGASISKKLYLGDTLYTNWNQTAVERSSIVCSPGTNGGESSIGFRQNIQAGGSLYVVGQNVAGSGNDTLAFYSSTFNSWMARFDGTGKFYTRGIMEINTENALALLSINATNTGAGDPILSSFLAPSITVGIPTSYFGANRNSTYNCATQKFFYFNDGNIENYLELQTLNSASNSLLIKGNLTFNTGLFFTKGIYNANWDQGVANGTSAIRISPSVGAGQASIAFSTDINFTGGIWTMGQNVNGAGDETFTLYYAPYNRRLFTFNGITGLMTTSAGAAFAGSLSTLIPASVTTSTTLLSLLQPSAANSTFRSIEFGVAASTYNQAELKFNYIAAGSDNNNISIGLTNSSVFRMYPALGLFEAPIFRLLGSTSGYINLQCPATTSNYSLTFPSSSGSNGQVLTTNGSGVTSWATPAAQSSAFTTPVTITLASASTVSTPALSVSLTGSSATNYYATFLNTAAPSNSKHSILLGPLLVDCAYFEYNYVTTANVNNYISLGTPGFQQNFKFYPGLQNGTIYTGVLNLNSGTTTAGLACRTSATTSSNMAYFFQDNPNNNTVQSILLGKSTDVYNCGEINFNYIANQNDGNFIELKTAVGSNTLQIKPTYTYAKGGLFVKGVTYFNWDQGVPNGDPAIAISPSLQGGQASLEFRTDLNNGGRRWRIGQNVNGQGDDNFCFYNSTYNANVGYINNNAVLFMKGAVVTPQLYTEDNLIIEASYTNSKKINIHCGGYNTGGTYINSGISTGDHPTYGSTNIGNRNLGNCLFVGANRENYSTNANGVLNVSVTNTNNTVCGFYGTNNGTANFYAGNIELYYNPTTQQWVTGYNTASDYRLKHNVKPMTDGLDIIMALKPSYFNFAAEATGFAAGFIAHELQEIISDAVFGEKDALHEDGAPKYQSISQTHIIPFLVQSVQNLTTQLVEQKSMIADLLARLLILEQK
jgi:hypothetical protein